MVLAIFVRNSRTPIYVPNRNQQLSVALWLPYCLSSAEMMRRRSAMKREGMKMFNHGLNSIALAFNETGVVKNVNTKKLVALDPDRKSVQAAQFETELRHRVVGQERAVRKLASVYQVFQAGMTNPTRPIGTMLFLGPTGSGKTHVVEAAAEVLFGDRNAVIKIDCAEFQHSHEIAKLIGSPPGYLGQRETSALLSQEALNQHHTEKMKLSLVLFDEIEKASDSLWNLLLGILDKATLTLGDNRKVDFSAAMVFL